MLWQQYVQMKSMVFIVDNEFEVNPKYGKKINEVVKTYFKELDDQDNYGFISLSKEFHVDNIELEKKGKNTRLKENTL